MTSRVHGDEKGSFEYVKILAVLAVVVFLAGVGFAWIAAQVESSVSPSLILGATITTSVMLLCCSSYIATTSYSAKIPVYEEMEMEFRKGMQLFGNKEWQEALMLFKDLMGPKMNHKRALYYAARCSEELSDWEGVKLYCRKYLEMKRKDKEVWEMLARAHKRLFEYEEAEDALAKASRL